MKTLVSRAADDNCRVVGVRRGWGGLLHFDANEPASREKHLIPLDRQTVRTVDRTGGTFLHTSRTNPARVSSFKWKDSVDPGASRIAASAPGVMPCGPAPTSARKMRRRIGWARAASDSIASFSSMIPSLSKLCA